VHCCAWRHRAPSRLRDQVITAQPSNAERRVGKQDAQRSATVAVTFLEVSEFHHIPHWAITPHYFAFGRRCYSQWLMDGINRHFTFRMNRWDGSGLSEEGWQHLQEATHYIFDDPFPFVSLYLNITLKNTICRTRSLCKLKHALWVTPAALRLLCYHSI
jgi:hypothetical protein